MRGATLLELDRTRHSPNGMGIHSAIS